MILYILYSFASKKYTRVRILKHTKNNEPYYEEKVIDL
jgi:hypothetical protein